ARPFGQGQFHLAVLISALPPKAGLRLSAPFRQGLTARKRAWAVGIPRHLKVYPADVQMIWPVVERDRPRQRHVPNILSMAAEDMLADARWRNITCAPEQKESSRLVLLLPACGSPTDHRSGLGTRVSNICQGMRLGSSAKLAFHSNGGGWCAVELITPV